MSHPHSAALAATAVGLICAGCVTSPLGPLPQATPSWSCTPVTGGTPYACYENQYQDAAAQNKLYEEAEAVLGKLNEEQARIYRAGGTAEPTPVLLETTTGKALDSLMATYRDLLNDSTRLVSGKFKIAWMQRRPDIAKEGSSATLEVCSDISAVVMQSKGEKPRRIGKDTDERYYLSSLDGVLRVSLIEHKWVETC